MKKAELIKQIIGSRPESLEVLEKAARTSHVGAAAAEEFPGRIHHRAAAGLPGRWRMNQSNEVAFSSQRN